MVKKENKMPLFIIARMLDILSTLININKWGSSVEGNPLMRQVFEKGLFLPYQIFITTFIILLVEPWIKYKKIIYISLSILSLLVFVSNLLCYFFIK